MAWRTLSISESNSCQKVQTNFKGLYGHHSWYHPRLVWRSKVSEWNSIDKPEIYRWPNVSDYTLLLIGFSSERVDAFLYQEFTEKRDYFKSELISIAKIIMVYSCDNNKPCNIYSSCLNQDRKYLYCFYKENNYIQCRVKCLLKWKQHNLAKKHMQ